MNIESKLTSLELSKRLYELGVKQESLFYWNLYGDGIKIWYEIRYHEQNSTSVQFSAFTALELLELLPYKIINNGELFRLDIFKLKKEFKVSYINHYYDLYYFFEENVCDSLARMLIHLLENNLLETK